MRKLLLLSKARPGNMRGAHNTRDQVLSENATIIDSITIRFVEGNIVLQFFFLFCFLRKPTTCTEVYI